MAIRSRELAVEAALNSHVNEPGTCQLWTRTQFNAPSAGDRDGDKDYDAVDGWLSEPTAAKHYDDRNPPLGVPVAFSGGSKGYGHRAISLGRGMIRSTDMSDNGLLYQSGNVGTTTISSIERAMGVRYLGWSETITGLPIPFLAKEPVPPKPKNNNVTKARDLLVKAKRFAKKNNKPRRFRRLKKMLSVGPKD